MGLDLATALDCALMLVLLVTVVVCGLTDMLKQRIWNVVTFPAAGLGLLLNVAFLFVDTRLGVQFALSSLMAFAVGFAIFLVIFLGGGMGGGDVKYVAAVCAMDPFHFGYQWALWTVFWSIMASGAMALVIITMQGRLISSFRHVFRSIFTAVMPGLEHERLKPENSSLMPFGYGVSVGTLCTVLFFHYGYLPY